MIEKYGNRKGDHLHGINYERKAAPDTSDRKNMKKENCEDPVIKARGHSRSTTVIFLLYY